MKTVSVIIVLILFFSFQLFPKENINFSPNWEKYRIEISSKIKLETKNGIDDRSYWRDWVREQTIGQVSVSLENFLINDQMLVKDILKSNQSFARKYVTFLEMLYPKYFSIKRDHAFTDILIPLRGPNSFLNIIPLPWGTLSYKDLEPSEYVGEAYQVKEAKGSFSKSLAPVIYSGLIIDVRGYGFQPSLSPKIYSQSGQLIYGAEYIHPKLGFQRGVVNFSKIINSKEVKRRTGEKPMFVVALDIIGKYKTNVVISYQDQKKIFDHTKSIQNLLKCKVAFIIN